MMKKNILLFLTCFLLVSCGNQKPSTENHTQKQLNILTTVYPLTYLHRKNRRTIRQRQLNLNPWKWYPQLPAKRQRYQPNPILTTIPLYRWHTWTIYRGHFITIPRKELKLHWNHQPHKTTNSSWNWGSPNPHQWHSLNNRITRSKRWQSKHHYFRLSPSRQS